MLATFRPGRFSGHNGQSGCAVGGLANDNIVDLNYTVLITDRAGKTTEEIHETHSMRYFFRPELELMLDQAGFELVSAQEWLSDRPLDFNTWNGVFVGRKK